MGITKVISIFQFLESSKHFLSIEYHVHIWQILPQRSYGVPSCQIKVWYKESNKYFCNIVEKYFHGNINERSSNKLSSPMSNLDILLCNQLFNTFKWRLFWHIVYTNKPIQVMFSSFACVRLIIVSD